MNKKKLRFGIIGFRMGMAHADGLKTLYGGELVAVCDNDAKILDEAMSHTGLDSNACYLDYKDMIKRDDIDIIIVACPDQIHCEHTIEALKAGKHVLCEKPMAMTVEECAMMIAASEETNKKLMIGQVCRYSPGFVAAKKLIDSGTIGELFYVESEYAHDYSESQGIGNWRIDPVRLRHPALGGGCHAVDLLRWIAGDPVSLCAFSNKKVLKDWPVDDCTVSILNFPNRVIGKVMVSVGCKRDYTMRSCFYGNQGTIIADNQLPYILVYKNQIKEQGKVFEGVQDKVIYMKYPVEINNHNTTAEIKEFIDIINEDKPVKTTGMQGAYTVATCMAMVESSSKNGQLITIDYNLNKK